MTRLDFKRALVTFLGTSVMSLLAFSVVLNLVPAPASASLFAYRLIDGVQNRQYWIDPGMINPVYGTLARSAVTSWNNSAPPIWFTEQSTSAGSETDFYAEDYTGAVTWDGVAVQRDASGNGVVACVGCGPFDNWVYTEVSLNDYYLRTYPYAWWSQSVAAHEFGHSVAIAHTSVGAAVMQASTQIRTNNGVYTPQSDDIYWASQLAP